MGGKSQGLIFLRHFIRDDAELTFLYPYTQTESTKGPCFHSPTSLQSAKCTLLYHQDTVLLTKSKRSQPGQSTPPAYIKKKSFSFLSLAQRFAHCCMIGRQPLPFWRGIYSDQRRDTHAPTHMPASGCRSTNFSSAHLCSSCMAPSSTCAKFDAGFSVRVSSTRAKELPCFCHISLLRALW